MKMWNEKITEIGKKTANMKIKKSHSHLGNMTAGNITFL